MSVRAGTGLSQHADVRAGAVEAAQQTRDGLDGADADLVFVFASGAHLAAPETLLEAVHDVLAPGALVGCGAGGVVGAGLEVENGTAVAVWAAALGRGRAETFHVHVEPEGDGLSVEGLPSPTGASAVLLLADPYSFPTDRVLHEIGRVAPGVPVLGGLSSARTLDGASALLCDGEVLAGGAVGVRLADVEVLPCVSQGAVPVGVPLTVTAADGHVIRSLDERPALAALRDAVDELGPDERAMIAGGLLLGLRVTEGGPDSGLDEYLVRGLLGADPETGTVAVGNAVGPGNVVRLHARDAGSADVDLRTELGLRREALGSEAPAGALMFTCNGRGSGMFGVANHDIDLLAAELGGPPVAGFFAAGEIGPVGGHPFLHGFTATVAVFA
jgi:small ligand-binding sensory domain FIST